MPKKLFKKRRWRVRIKGKDGPSFSSKLISTDGIICLVLGIATSPLPRAGAGLHLGTPGVVGFVVSLTCFIISVKTLNDEYIAETIPKIAAVVNFVVLLIFMGLYAYGIFMGMV